MERTVQGVSQLVWTMLCRSSGKHLRSNCCLWSAAPAVRISATNQLKANFLKNQIFGGNSDRSARASSTTDVLVSVGCGRGYAGHVRLEPSFESPLVESLWMSPSIGKCLRSRRVAWAGATVQCLARNGEVHDEMAP